MRKCTQHIYYYENFQTMTNFFVFLPDIIRRPWYTDKLWQKKDCYITDPPEICFITVLSCFCFIPYSASEHLPEYV